MDMANCWTRIFDKIFRNKAGKLVLWQNPNFPLWGWIITSIFASVFKHGVLHTGLQRFAETSLFAWAYLEIRSGETVFRRALGSVILAYVTYGFFTAR